MVLVLGVMLGSTNVVLVLGVMLGSINVVLVVLYDVTVLGKCRTRMLGSWQCYIAA